VTTDMSRPAHRSLHYITSREYDLDGIPVYMINPRNTPPISQPEILLFQILTIAQ
jgi:hypothetical protein